jgi:hypothetical protein
VKGPPLSSSSGVSGVSEHLIDLTEQSTEAKEATLVEAKTITPSARARIFFIFHPPWEIFNAKISKFCANIQDQIFSQRQKANAKICRFFGINYQNFAGYKFIFLKFMFSN